MTKWFTLHKRVVSLGQLALVGGIALLNGCATSDTPDKPDAKAAPAAAGVTLKPSPPVDGVWLTNGFDFKGYEALYIAPTVFAGVERSNEVDIRAMAMGLLVEQLESHIREAKLFSTVTTNAASLKPGSKSLTMQNTIVEYARGGTAGRIMAGVFGAGQPVIKVRGRILDEQNLVCVYELKRSGAGDEAKFLGGGKSDEEIQRNDIRVLASDLTVFLKRTANIP